MRHLITAGGMAVGHAPCSEIRECRPVALPSVVLLLSELDIVDWLGPAHNAYATPRDNKYTIRSKRPASMANRQGYDVVVDVDTEVHHAVHVGLSILKEQLGGPRPH